MNLTTRVPTDAELAVGRISNAMSKIDELPPEFLQWSVPSAILEVALQLAELRVQLERLPR